MELFIYLDRSRRTTLAATCLEPASRMAPWLWTLSACLLIPALLRGTSLGADCNRNGVDDALDIEGQTSADCNLNGIPDECDLEKDFSFRTSPRLLEGDTCLHVAPTDLDGDGDLDLVVLRSQGRISLLTHRGGVFEPTGELVMLLVQTSLLAADVTGDGHPDLIVPNTGIIIAPGSTVAVFRNLGDGTFSGAVEFDAGRGPAAVAASDADADGDLDLYVRTQGSMISVLINDGAGSFTRGQDVAQADLSLSLRSELYPGRAAADLDGDGDAERIEAQGTQGTILVYDNLGGEPPRFDVPVSFWCGNHPQAVAAADLDGDGDMDVVTTNSGDGNANPGSVTVFLNDLSGVLRPDPYITGPAPRHLACIDTDSDGDLDLAVAHAGFQAGGAPLHPGNLAILENRGDGKFLAPRNIVVAEEALALSAADLDGDDVLELVLAARTETIIFRGLPSGEFERLVSVPSRARQTAFRLADLDGDGDLDILEATFDGVAAALSTYRNDGGVAFSLRSVTPLPRQMTALSCGDVEGDGDLDVAGVPFDWVEMYILRNDGLGGMALPGAVTVSEGLVDLAFTELDGDGAADLVVAATRAGDSGVAVLFHNDGGGLFSAGKGFALGGRPGRVSAVDLDGDLDTDICVGGTVGYSAAVLLADEAGGLTLQSVPTGEAGPFLVVSADLDGQGPPELVTLNAGSRSMALLRSGRDSGFHVEARFLTGEEPKDLCAADLDGDGMLDLAVLDAGTRDGVPAQVTIFINTSESPVPDCNGNSTPDSCDVSSGLSADVNDDRIPDECQAASFRRGDANADTRADMSDAIWTLSELFREGPPTPCRDASDTNDDGFVDISDPVYLLRHVFFGLEPPPSPYDECGPDETLDDLDCLSFAPCAG